MNRIVSGFFLTLLLFSSTCLSQLVNGKFNTSFYTWEKVDTVGKSTNILRAFETVQLNLTQDDVSFQSYFNVASNLAGKFGDETTVRVSNTFLKVRNVFKAVDVSLGRVPVFAGVGNGTIDGALFRAKTSDEKFSFTGYGGANVHGNLQSKGFDNLNKNFFIGGQIISSHLEGTRIGMSYANQRVQRESYFAKRPDSLFNPITYLITPDSKARQVLGLDINHYHFDNFSIYGRYDYDMNAKYALRNQLGVRAQLNNTLAVTGEFLYRKPDIPFNSFFTVFPQNASHEYEAGVEYMFSPSIHTYGKFAYVNFSPSVTRRMTLGVNTDYVSFNYAGNNGYAGVLASYNVQGNYPFMEQKIIPTLGFSYAQYHLADINVDVETAFSTSLGVIVRPSSCFSFDTQVQWLNNKVADKDIRVFGKLSYWFTHNLNLFSKKEIAE